MTTLLCVICQRREPTRAQVCNPDRIRLAGTLASIVELWRQLPDALQPGQSAAQRVTGSRDAPIPARIDVIDLTAAVRNGSATPEAREHPEDQIGHPAVAAILDQWCRDWRDEMAFAQTLPLPTVPELARWLTDRLDWACDRHPAVDEFATEMRQLRAVLFGTLGLFEPEPEFCNGVVCRGCDRYALYRSQDRYAAECDECGMLYTEDEYREWSALVSAQVRCAECDQRPTKAVRSSDGERVTYYPCGHTAAAEIGKVAA